MFLGEYQHTLDAKGRVSLPRRFRDQAGGKLVVSKGLEKCLYVLPAVEFDEFASRLVSGNDLMGNQRELRRHFFAGADEVDVDSAGRIALKSSLRAHAGLSKEVAVIGNADRIEIWDAAAWEQYSSRIAAGIEDAAEELADKGIL
jgi:MraZ protein